MPAFSVCLLALVAFGPLLFSPAQALDTKVELVQILFRHGDRTPVTTFPNDQYKESAWEKFGGFGQLTQAGMRRHFDYGRFLRQRYASFLNATYSKNRVYVRSTDYDRTLMSAYSLLSGIFEPETYQIWNPDIKWQPIPVHTTEAAYDNVNCRELIETFNFEDADFVFLKVFFSNPCPRMDQLRQDVRNTDEFKSKNAEYTDLFKVLETNTGNKNIDLDNIWSVIDAIFIEKTNNFTLPRWADEVYARLISIGGYGFYFDFRYTEIAKLVSGGILREMRKNIVNKTLSKNSTKELYLFSGHDTYVAGLTKLLDLTPFINQPPFTSSVTLELRRTLTDNPAYFVQAFLKNNTADEPIVYRSLPIKGCEELCPLDKFLKLTEDLEISDISSACKKQLDNGAFTKLLLYLVVGFTSVVVFLVAIVSVSTFRQIKKKSPARRHQPL